MPRPRIEPKIHFRIRKPRRPGGRPALYPVDVIYLSPILPITDWQFMKQHTRRSVKYGGKLRRSHGSMVHEMVEAARMLKEIKEGMPEHPDLEQLSAYGLYVLKLFQERPWPPDDGPDPDLE